MTSTTKWRDLSFDDRRDELRRMLKLGMSYSEIATELDTTRNAVGGAIHRLRHDKGEAMPKTGNTSPPPKPKPKPKVERRAPPKRTPAPKPESPPLPVLAAHVPQTFANGVWEAPAHDGPISILQLNEHTCKWPYGDPVRSYCGQHAEEHQPYCAQHHALAYQAERPPQPKRPKYTDRGLISATAKLIYGDGS